MSIDQHTLNKQALVPLRRSLYNYHSDTVHAALRDVFHQQAKVQLAYPFEGLEGADGLYHAALEPLYKAIPDLERRDTIVMAGPTDQGGDWVGCCGYYTGSSTNSWLDIPATGHQVSMRFHEFYRIVEGR